MPKKSRKRSLTEEDQESAPSSPAKKTKTRAARSRPEVSSKKVNLSFTRFNLDSDTKKHAESIGWITTIVY